MAQLAKRQGAGWWGRARLTACLPALLGLLAGCVGMDKADWGMAPPASPVCKIVATWQNTLREAPDTYNGGRRVQGLAGRVWLFGADQKFPLVGNGNISVAAWDDQAPTAKMLHAWNIEPVSAKRFLQPDMIGQGYSLFLPWPHDVPSDKARLRLRVCYTPPDKDGKIQLISPHVYCEDVITIAPENGVITNTQRQYGPAAAAKSQ